MAVIQSFLDESGTNAEAPVLCVAGAYGSQGEWETFRREWRPYSEGFHAKSSTALFSLLCDAIKWGNINAFLVSIGKDTYREFATAHLKTAVGNAYSVCAMLCAMSLCDQVPNQPLSVVLEAGQPNVGFVKQVLEALMDSGTSCIAAVATAQKKDFIELHVADFVSHICSSNDRDWMKLLFDMKRLKHAHITKKMIEDAAPVVTDLFRKAKAMRREARGSR